MKNIVFLLAMSFVMEAWAEDSPRQFNTFEDAAVAAAQEWQKGAKARPIMSSDGMVRFAYGQTMPKLTCSPTRACDVEMEPGEEVMQVVLGDSANWKWVPADSKENGKLVHHVVIQPLDNSLETNLIIMTSKRSYHIKLVAPKVEGAYLNRIGFYYPQDLVTNWTKSNEAALQAEVAETEGQVLDTAVSLDKLDFDYKIEGAKELRPKRVFNDGGRVYIEMPKGINAEESPILLLLDENNKVQVVNYRVKNDATEEQIHYVVDKLFRKAELRLGGQRVKITWTKKEPGFFRRMARRIGFSDN